MPDVERTLELRGGRRLGFAEYGRPDGEPCFYFHGHPGSRFEAEVAHEVAAGAGIRVLALDRPGYGRSDFEPNRTILSWSRDVEAVADQLRLERFAVLGASGGGPYALACGHALPERVRRIGLISSIAPYQATGVTRGMRWQNRVGFQAGARFPPLSRLIMWSMGRQLRRDPERTLDALVSAMSPSDVEIARRPEIRRMLRADVTEAFRQCSRGAARCRAARRAMGIRSRRDHAAGSALARRAGRARNACDGPPPGADDSGLPGDLLSGRGSPARLRAHAGDRRGVRSSLRRRRFRGSRLDQLLF